MDTVTYPIISSYWEVMDLKDGDLFINNITGKHARLKNPSPLIKEVIYLLDGTRNIEQILSNLRNKGFNLTKEMLSSIISNFTSKGIVVENVEKCLPNWFTPEMYSRFKTLISSFESLENNSIAALEAFKKIRDVKIGIIGLGGTGSMLAMMLAATGVTYLKVKDGDRVDISNLVRQIFYDPDAIGRYKTDVLKEKLQKFSPDIMVETSSEFINSYEEAIQFSEGLDFIFMQADAPRFLLNRWVNQACVKLNIPYIYCFSGQVGPMFIPNKSACFNCFEQHVKTNMSVEHETIVQELQRQRTRQYPSVVTGSTIASHYQFIDAINYIIGKSEPITMNNIIRFKGKELISKEKMDRLQTCEVCGGG